MPKLSPTIALQTALIARLRANAALTTALGGSNKVFDYVPSRTAYPYVVYYETDRFEQDTVSGRSSEHIVSVHAFSDKEGSKQVQAILQLCDELLQDYAATLTDHRLVNLKFVSADQVKEEQVYHAIAQYRAYTEES
jgi:hypothetical protein